MGRRHHVRITQLGLGEIDSTWKTQTQTDNMQGHWYNRMAFHFEVFHFPSTQSNNNNDPLVISDITCEYFDPSRCCDGNQHDEEMGWCALPSSALQWDLSPGSNLSNHSFHYHPSRQNETLILEPSHTPYTLCLNVGVQINHRPQFDKLRMIHPTLLPPTSPFASSTFLKYSNTNKIESSQNVEHKQQQQELPLPTPHISNHLPLRFTFTLLNSAAMTQGQEEGQAVEEKEEEEIFQIHTLAIDEDLPSLLTEREATAARMKDISPDTQPSIVAYLAVDDLWTQNRPYLLAIRQRDDKYVEKGHLFTIYLPEGLNQNMSCFYFYEKELAQFYLKAKKAVTAKRLQYKQGKQGNAAEVALPSSLNGIEVDEIESLSFLDKYEVASGSKKKVIKQYYYAHPYLNCTNKYATHGQKLQGFFIFSKLTDTSSTSSSSLEKQYMNHYYCTQLSIQLTTNTASKQMTFDLFSYPTN